MSTAIKSYSKAVTKENTSIETRKLWNKPENFYTSDRLFDAYLMGKQEGIDSRDRIIIKAIRENMNIVTRTAQELLEYFKYLKIKIDDIYLRILDIDDFELLFLIDDKDFEQYDEKILDAYTKSGEYRKKENNDDFHIDISFVPHTKYFDYEHVKCDGFGLTYALLK